jgi:hypothetical protein
MTTQTDPGESARETETIRRIRANAALLVQTLASQTDFAFGFDSRSVEWLDGYINRIRTDNWSEKQIDQLVSNFGSYLGEAILAAHGGAWAQDEHGWQSASMNAIGRIPSRRSESR